MTVTVRDLEGLPLDGITGLNEIRAAIVKDADDKFWHLIGACNCENNFVKDESGFTQMFIIPLGDAFEKLCSKSLDAEEIPWRFGSDTFTHGIKPSTVLYIIRRFKELYPSLSEIESMGVVEAFLAIDKIIISYEEADFPEVEQYESDWDNIFEHIGWFSNFEVLFEERIKMLHERLRVGDSQELDRFFATEVLKAYVPKLQGRPEAAEVFEKAVSQEIEAYVKDTSVHLTHLVNMGGHTTQTFLAVGGDFWGLTLLSSAALDYLKECRAFNPIRGSVRLSERPTDEVIENTAGLHAPKDASSALNSLAAAYAAALKV